MMFSSLKPRVAVVTGARPEIRGHNALEAVIYGRLKEARSSRD